jgi:hypothetical protein
MSGKGKGRRERGDGDQDDDTTEVRLPGERAGDPNAMRKAREKLVKVWMTSNTQVTRHGPRIVLSSDAKRELAEVRGGGRRSPFCDVSHDRQWGGMGGSSKCLKVK